MVRADPGLSPTTAHGKANVGLPYVRKEKSIKLFTLSMMPSGVALSVISKVSPTIGLGAGLRRDIWIYGRSCLHIQATVLPTIALGVIQKVGESGAELEERAEPDEATFVLRLVASYRPS